ncbi:unnamed protein product [Aphanomyces euteiches]|uniref:Uncharacterized protein n=1 Tax=Aphanomyces euteiches TaxID=100861 RepID=A0A6G0XFC3_9STRA|nr:hypothetical protein Ae201684_005486 [Aphanomyces euteiches]KAH9092529.1 hypothetical protein Ae201684P_008204 [Aphanomyces euteiches]
MKSASVAASVASLACLVQAQDICQSRYCYYNGVLCDRSILGNCPPCLSGSVGGSGVKCTDTLLLGVCAQLGIGDTKCTKPWSGSTTPSPTPTDDNSTPSPTDDGSSSGPTEDPLPIVTPKPTETPTQTPKTTSTTSTPTTTKPTSSNTSTTKPVTTSPTTTTPTSTDPQNAPTTEPANSGTGSDTKKDSSGLGVGAYIGIGVGALAVLLLAGFIVYRMKNREDDEDEDEETGYKPTTAQAQYNPYSNNPAPYEPRPPAIALPAATAAANLRSKLNNQSDSNSVSSEPRQPPPSEEKPLVVSAPTVQEGSRRQKSVHTDVWGNVPSSFREGVDSSSNSGSFLSPASLRQTGNSANSDGNSANGDGKRRDNDTTMSVEF